MRCHAPAGVLDVHAEAWLARTANAAGDRRGIALPMALVTLGLLASLSALFATLARTEPMIAVNHLRSEQARVMAESGLEYALWALTHATAEGGFGGETAGSTIVPAEAPAAPFDGSRFVRAGATGGFVVTVTGSSPNARVVKSVGWSPDEDVGATSASSRSVAVATLARLRSMPDESPCALCAVPSVALSGPMHVDARDSGSSDCGAKAAVVTAGELTYDGGVRLFGSRPSSPETPPNAEGTDWRSRASVPVLQADDLDTVKALAVAGGTYVRPPSEAVLDLRDLPDGVVFVDTPAGTSALTPTNRASVRLGPGFARHSPFRGWIVVNGDVSFEGQVGDVTGLVYAANTVTATDTAGSRVSGMVVAAGLLGAPMTTLGQLAVRFDCAAARGSGLVPAGWFVRPGSYCDDPGGC
jgi:hypothetical protein